MALQIKDSISFKNDQKQRVNVTGITEIMGSIGNINIMADFLKQQGFQEEPLLLSK
jgi:hypothetical protein